MRKRQTVNHCMAKSGRASGPISYEITKTGYSNVDSHRPLGNLVNKRFGELFGGLFDEYFEIDKYD